MARRTVMWHIGPTDPGTDFLGTALQRRRGDLEALGIGVPQGRWHEVEDQIWDHKGLSILSTPDVARAGDDKVALRLAGLRDIELHLVLLVRDLPSQVYSAWQATLQHGSTTSLEKYAARVLDPARGHWQAEEFWTGRDLTAFLPRWTRAIHADRVHVVATPAEVDGVWDAFLRQPGIGDLSRPDVLVPPVRGASLPHDRVLEITTAWSKLVAERGFDLQGSLIAPSASPVTVDGRDDQLDALTELLTATTAEVERLSVEVDRLQADNAPLDRKRRKHKRKLADLARARA